jgi:hypothetical protein
MKGIAEVKKNQGTGKGGVAQVALKLKERLKISGKCQGGI